jgi:PQQ-like domain
MEILNNRTIAILIVALLIVSMGASAILLPNVGAQVQREFTTETFMNISPNPAGVNQPVTVFVWLSLAPFQYGNSFSGWNMTVAVTAPDGTVTNLALPKTLPTGYTYVSYTPTATGTYNLQANFDKVTVNMPIAASFGAPAGNYTFDASKSTVQKLNVTTDQVQPWPETPLPAGYWQTPITAENHNWYSLIGNWLSSGIYNGGSPTINQGPLSSHILWTQPISFGGLSGGTYQGSQQRAGNTYGLNYYTGLLYQNKLGQWIINGYMYYDINPPGSMFTTGLPGVRCINLRTGALVWENLSMPQITCAQVYTIDAGLMSGSQAFLWTASGTTWYQYDAFTGRLVTQYTNVATTMGMFGPSALGLSPVYGPSGEILVYDLSEAGHWLAMWNSTLAVQYPVTDPNAQNYQPSSSPSRPWSNGVQWNVTIPAVAGSPSASIYDYPDGVIVAEGQVNASTDNPIFVDVGYSTTTGAQLWQQNRTNVGWGQGGPAVPGLLTFGNAFGDGYYAFFQRETQQWHIINIQTGLETALTPALNTITGNDWSYYDWAGQIAYGALYTTGYSGDVCAFDVKTGASLWTFSEGNSGIQTPFGSWPTFGGVTIANGIIYYGPSEHTPPTPMYRGYQLYAINASTGKEIWSIPAVFVSMAVADGELTGYNGYDNQIYAFGKGLSATTVTTAGVIGSDTQVLIKGTVTDQSPGQTAIGIPEAGTPAISDTYMSNWMAYLFQQQPEPMNATGVPVTLSYIDPNNNTYAIGQTTSDITGQFSCLFTPTVPGKYTITATFGGSDSYYTSTAQTTMQFASQAESTPTSAPLITNAATTADLMTYMVVGVIAIIIAIAIVGLLLLKKKP